MSQFMKIHKSYRFWLLIIPPLISLSLYFSSLNYFFFQDDFYEILISRVNNFEGFLSLFKFLSNRSSYRPVGLQTYFFTSYSLFGLNPIAFRTITFGLFFISYFLIIKVIKKITGSHQIGFLTASLWVLSAIHFMSLTWIAASWLIIGLFFFLVASLLFLDFSQKERKIYYILSFIFFVLSALSFEFFVSFPLIFGYYCLFIQKKSLWQTVKICSPFLLIIFIYLIFRSQYSYLPNIPEYRVAFNFESLKALFWYILWSFNKPEEFKKQVITFLVVPSRTFVNEFWPLVAKTVVSALLIILLGILLPIFKNLKNHKNINLILIGFGTTWFVTSISPVLILPNHSFSMYLTLASIGIYLIISYLIISFNRVSVIIVIFLIWLFSSFTTISFYRDSSWMIESQNFARQFATQLKSRFPQLPPDAVVFYPLSAKRHIQAVLNQNEIKVIYNNPSISIFYNEADFIEYLKENPTNNIYKF